MTIADKPPSLSIVIPCYRSAQWLADLVRRIDAVMQHCGKSFEILLINDGSNDDTWPVIEQLSQDFPFVRGFDLLFNTGQFRATICGLEHARGEMILTMDDDGQHAPEEIPKLLDATETSPGHDCVIGAFAETRQNLVRRIGSAFAGHVNSYLFGKPRNLKLTAFRLMNRVTAQAICAHRTALPVIGPLLLQCTSRIANATIEHHPRIGGRSGYTFRSLVRPVFDNILAGSTLPLRAVSLLGLLSASASFVLGIFYLLKYLLGGIGVPGFATQVLLIVFFGGMTLLSIGLVGEYINRITHETARSPRYFLRQRTDVLYSPIRSTPEDQDQPSADS